jgi:hypothetical protein
LPSSSPSVSRTTLARDRLEGIRDGIQGHEFLLFARRAGIDAIGHQLSSLLSPVARLLQSDVM